MSNSGRYKYDKISGKVVQVSDRVPSVCRVPDWKRNMNPEDEIRRGYESIEAQGKLRAVDDKEVWQNYARR